MPNWTANVLDITGDEAQLKDLLSKIFRVEKEESVIDFNGTVPMPKELLETNRSPQDDALQSEYREKYGAGNGYDWACKFWGTKWNAGDACEPEEIEGGVRLRFNTAWCGPLEWIATTSKQYNSLKFTDCCQYEGSDECSRFECGFEDGVFYYNEEDMPQHDWYMEFDSNYNDEYTFITEGEYADVIDRYSTNSELDYGSMAEALLKRIKDDDLPLFMNFEWWDQNDEFESRLKGKPISTEVSHDN